MLVGCATAASLFSRSSGTIVYMIVRPPEFLEDVRERELEIAAAEARLASVEQHACPYCDFEVERAFLRCPSCLRRLKEPCATCGKPLDPRWKICPYCEAEVGQAPAQPARAASAGRRRPASAPPASAPAGPAAPPPQAATAAPARAARATPAPSQPQPAASRTASTSAAPSRARRRPPPSARPPGRRRASPTRTERTHLMDRTLILVKPDAFERGLTGEIIARFERKGLKIAALKHMTVDARPGRAALRRAQGQAVLRRAGRLHHRRPARGDGARGPRGGHRRPPGDRRHQPARGRPRLDPRRLRPRGRRPTWSTARTPPSPPRARSALFFPEL